MDIDWGARMRAARAYSGLDLARCAEATGIGTRTLQRIESGNRPMTLPEARVTADVCGVPLSFLVDGWPDPTQLDEIEADLSEVRRIVDGLADVLEERLLLRLAQASATARPRNPAQAAGENHLAGA